MNKDYVLFNLREAQEELLSTIRSMETEPDYGEGEFSVAMMHLYHHINTAWNAREATAKQAEDCSEQDFNAWRRFPSDLAVD